MAARVDDPLADLGFQLFTPSPWLRPFVAEYWHFRRTTPLAAYRDEYMHPRGGFGIGFNLGGPLRLDGRPLTDPVFLDGANTVSRQMGFIGQVELMGVRFFEGGAYPFLGMPLYELRNETAILDALGRPELLRLHARLSETPAMAARVQLLEEWLTGRLALGKERHTLIPLSLRRLRQGGELAMPALARDLSVSQRQLERLYQTQVGLSPKHYARLVRVEQARLALRQHGDATTASLAAELGYFDQAHFVHEFSAVVGMSPSAYRQHHRRQPGGK